MKHHPLFFQHAEDITLHMFIEPTITFWMPSYLMKEYTKDDWLYWRDKNVHLEGQILNTKDKEEGMLKYGDLIFLK